MGIWKDTVTLLANWQMSLWLGTSINSDHQLGVSISSVCHTTQVEALSKEGLGEHSCQPGSSYCFLPNWDGSSPLRNSATCGLSIGGPIHLLLSPWEPRVVGESHWPLHFDCPWELREEGLPSQRFLKHNMPSGFGGARWGSPPFYRITRVAHHWGDLFLMASHQAPLMAPQASLTMQMPVTAWLSMAAGPPMGDRLA